MTSIILIGVVGSLCFSVGEGLHLTPFPISQLIRVAASETTLTTQGSDRISDYTYGPLDVPRQIQKRNKRQAVTFDVPLPSHTCDVPASFCLAQSHERSDIVSVLVVSHSAGRAPPLVS